jgi:hypothetical protein
MTMEDKDLRRKQFDNKRDDFEVSHMGHYCQIYPSEDFVSNIYLFLV